MIKISAQPKLKVSNFHLGIAFIQNQSPMKTGVTMNQKAKIQFEKWSASTSAHQLLETIQNLQTQQWARGYAIAKLGHLANREKA